MITKQRIKLLASQLQRNLSTRASLSEAAHKIGLEPTYLSRRFKEVMGMSFSAWNRETRVEAAKVLLHQGYLSVTEVAHRVGYNDITTFERNFKKSVSMTPRQYCCELTKRT